MLPVMELQGIVVSKVLITLSTIKGCCIHVMSPDVKPFTSECCDTSFHILGSPSLLLGQPPKQTGSLCPAYPCTDPTLQSSSICRGHHVGSVPFSLPLLGWTQAAQTGQWQQWAEEGVCSSTPFQDCSLPGPLQSRFLDLLWRGQTALTSEEEHIPKHGCRFCQPHLCNVLMFRLKINAWSKLINTQSQ